MSLKKNSLFLDVVGFQQKTCGEPDAGTRQVIACIADLLRFCDPAAVRGFALFLRDELQKESAAFQAGLRAGEKTRTDADFEEAMRNLGF